MRYFYPQHPQEALPLSGMAAERHATPRAKCTSMAAWRDEQAALQQAQQQAPQSKQTADPQDCVSEHAKATHVILQLSTRSSDEPLNEIQKWTGTWGP